MAMFLWNWIRCSLRAAGSSTFQKAWPATVVGIIDPASANAANRGSVPEASSAPPTTCTAPFPRTISSSSTCTGTTLRNAARVAAA